MYTDDDEESFYKVWQKSGPEIFSVKMHKI